MPMPIEKARLQQIIDSVERYLDENKDKVWAAYNAYKDDCLDPLKEPRQPFSDSSPSNIHGQPKRDLFLGAPTCQTNQI
jgi:hypothetical protein